VSSHFFELCTSTDHLSDLLVSKQHYGRLNALSSQKQTKKLENPISFFLSQIAMISDLHATSKKNNPRSIWPWDRLERPSPTAARPQPQSQLDATSMTGTPDHMDFPGPRLEAMKTLRQ
jgi:hypothetical protein